jgi:hypothetical protein
MSQLALVAVTPGDEGRGWVVCSDGEGHYFATSTSDRTACGDAKSRKEPWNVADVQHHLGVVPLCEHCKDAIMGRPRRER